MMPILSFNEAKRDELLEKADSARQKRQLRQAYDFLREALRYGENAAIFNRAATILNEMGEYEGALQVAQYALKVEPQSLPAKWEMALACERLWKLDEAIRLIEELPDEPRASRGEDPSGTTSWQERKINLLGACCVKRCDLAGARQAIFRGAKKGQLPQPLASRADRLETCLVASTISDKKTTPSFSPPCPSTPLGTSPELVEAACQGGDGGGQGREDATPIFHSHSKKASLGLRQWIEVMRGHRLLYIHRTNKSGTLHHIPGRSAADGFPGEHFVMAHLSFPDCGRIFQKLRSLARQENKGYGGVFACDQNSVAVTQAAAEILELPIVDFAKLSASKPILLCLASNHGIGSQAVSQPSKTLEKGCRAAPNAFGTARISHQSSRLAEAYGVARVATSGDMAYNPSDVGRVPPHGASDRLQFRPLRHDLFIMAKSFEREEFYDVVAPPHNRSLLGAWSEPMASEHRQIIGAIGECVNLPWSEASIQAYESMSQTSWPQGPDGFMFSALKQASPTQVASWLVQACEQAGEE